MQGLGSVLTQEDIGKHRLKSDLRNVNNSRPKSDENGVPEFFNKKLKSPYERKTEAELKLSAQQTILRSLNKDSSKPVINPKPKPKQNGTQNDQIRSTEIEDNMKKENEFTGLASVQRSRSIFESSDRNAKDPIKPAVAPKRMSLNRGKPVPIVPDKPTNKPALDNDPIIKLPAGQIITEDLYDDVESGPGRDIAAIVAPSSIENILPPPDNSSLQEDLYDDVQNTSNDFPLPPDEEDLYDDVTNQPSEPETSKTATVNVEAPIKVTKSFQEIAPAHMIVPFGIDKWLENIVLSHKAQLKSFVCLTYHGAPERIPTEDELEEDKLYDDIMQPVPKTDQKSEKERKKEERERAEKEKKEKRERAEKERKEKEREKKEKKRKEREYKNFQLSTDSPLSYTSCVSCCKDFIPKPKDKLDLAYSTGDEIKLIVPPASLKCPDGKILVHNINTDRIGYVYKQDFGIEDTVVETSGTVGTIPTEDEELYEDIPGLPSRLPPPPVPVTPRPALYPPPPEDFYNDVQNDGEQLYEPLDGT